METSDVSVIILGIPGGWRLAFFESGGIFGLKSAMVMFDTFKDIVKVPSARTLVKFV